MAACGHEDYPCCGCGDDMSCYGDISFCSEDFLLPCGDPESYCGDPDSFCDCDKCDNCEDRDDCVFRGDGDESMDGDHETGLRDAGFGVDEDYGCYGDNDND